MAARFFNTFLGFLWLDMVFDDLVRRHSSVFGETNVIIYSFFVVFFLVCYPVWTGSSQTRKRADSSSASFLKPGMGTVLFRLPSFASPLWCFFLQDFNRIAMVFYLVLPSTEFCSWFCFPLFWYHDLPSFTEFVLGFKTHLKSQINRLMSFFLGGGDLIEFYWSFYAIRGGSLAPKRKKKNKRKTIERIRAQESPTRKKQVNGAALKMIDFIYGMWNVPTPVIDRLRPCVCVCVCVSVCVCVFAFPLNS